MPQSKKVRDVPHFRVQVRDPFNLSWRDYRSLTFDSIERARAFQATLQGPVETRIVRYDGHEATPILDDA